MLRSVLTTVLDAIGAAVVVAGVALIYPPAAFIVGGGAVLVMSWAFDRPAPKGDDK